jgi:hypothetical protein
MPGGLGNRKFTGLSRMARGKASFGTAEQLSAPLMTTPLIQRTVPQRINQRGFNAEWLAGGANRAGGASAPCRRREKGCSRRWHCGRHGCRILPSDAPARVKTVYRGAPTCPSSRQARSEGLGASAIWLAMPSLGISVVERYVVPSGRWLENEGDASSSDMRLSDYSWARKTDLGPERASQ